jgi:hypothetical protein
MAEVQRSQAAADCDPRQILIPFDPRECISRSDAAMRAGVTVGTISGWCVKFGIGRRIGGHWKISKVALRMHLEGAGEALAAYHAGNRADPKVIAYLEEAGLTRTTAHPRRAD